MTCYDALISIKKDTSDRTCKKRSAFPISTLHFDGYCDTEGFIMDSTSGKWTQIDKIFQNCYSDLKIISAHCFTIQQVIYILPHNVHYAVFLCLPQFDAPSDPFNSPSDSVDAPSNPGIAENNEQFSIQDCKLYVFNSFVFISI